MYATRNGWLALFRILPNLVCVVLIVTLLSCDRSGVEQGATPMVQDKANNGAPSTTSTDKTTDERIQAGYGVPTCYLGMSIDELGKDWKRLKDPYLADYFYNRSERIVILQHAGHVEKVLFFYFSPEYEPFLGMTEEGIDARSSVEDVRKLRGDPSFIIESKEREIETYPGSQDTLIAYMEDGIVFSFVDGKLQLVTVSKPQPDFDYSGIEQDSTTVYIRPREKRASRSVAK